MKETKVKFKFNLKENLEKIKVAYGKVKTKIKENVKSGGLKKLDKQGIKYYSLLIVMLIVAFISTYANIKTYKETVKENYKTYTRDKENTEVKKEENEVTTNGQKTEEKTVAVSSPHYITDVSSISYVPKNDSTKYKFPADGVIKREYSMDKVIYYESLEVWKTHSGVDIVCGENSSVVAVLDGKVVGIYNDGVYGYSVVIESDEYKCIYSSLSSDIELTIGKIVKVGEKVGYVGECGAEKELGYHVHFEVMKNGEYVNPEVLGIK